MTLVELIQLLYSSESNKVHALKCTQSIQIKSSALKDISTAHVKDCKGRICKILSDLFVNAPQR